MKCPACDATTIVGSGDQVVSVTEIWCEEEVTDWNADDWHEKCGSWAWSCSACGHQWTEDAGATLSDAARARAQQRRIAQNIGEDARQAEEAYEAGDYDTLKACLETIQMHAMDLGYVPPADEDEDEDAEAEEPTACVTGMCVNDATCDRDLHCRRHCDCPEEEPL